MTDVAYAKGDVYLKIPKNGQGIVRVLVKGSYREIKAKSHEGIELPTGTKIIVMDTFENSVSVSKVES